MVAKHGQVGTEQLLSKLSAGVYTCRKEFDRLHDIAFTKERAMEQLRKQLDVHNSDMLAMEDSEEVPFSLSPFLCLSLYLSLC